MMSNSRRYCRGVFAMVLKIGFVPDRVTNHPCWLHIENTIYFLCSFSSTCLDVYPLVQSASIRTKPAHSTCSSTCSHRQLPDLPRLPDHRQLHPAALACSRPASSCLAAPPTTASCRPPASCPGCSLPPVIVDVCRTSSCVGRRRDGLVGEFLYGCIHLPR